LFLSIPIPVCVEGGGAGGGRAPKTRKDRGSEKDRRAERGERARERKKTQGWGGVGSGRERKIHPNTSRQKPDTRTKTATDTCSIVSHLNSYESCLSSAMLIPLMSIGKLTLSSSGFGTGT